MLRAIRLDPKSGVVYGPGLGPDGDGDLPGAAEDFEKGHPAIADEFGGVASRPGDV